MAGYYSKGCERRPKTQLTGDIPFQRPRMLSVRTTFKRRASIPTRLDLKADRTETQKKKNDLDPHPRKRAPHPKTALRDFFPKKARESRQHLLG